MQNRITPPNMDAPKKQSLTKKRDLEITGLQNQGKTPASLTGQPPGKTGLPTSSLHLQKSLKSMAMERAYPLTLSDVVQQLKCLQPLTKSALNKDHDSAWIPETKLTATGLFLPQKIPTEDQENLGEIIHALNQVLIPAKPEEIRGEISVLLSFYYVEDIPYEPQEECLKIFTEILKDFPRWAVKRACISMLETDAKRASPGEIKKLCLKDTAALRSLRQRAEALIEYNTKT